MLLCCACLRYARLQVPLHAVPVSHNASPPLACNLPATLLMPSNIVCCHILLLAASKLAKHDDAVPAELCCLVAPLLYVGVFATVGVQARGVDGVEWG